MMIAVLRRSGVCAGVSRDGAGEAGGCRVSGFRGGGDGMMCNHGRTPAYAKATAGRRTAVTNVRAGLERRKR